MKKLLLIDAHSLLHRCFHAVPDLTSPEGLPSGALYGTGGILLRILQEEKPDYCAAAFDLPTVTFRKEIYEQYKAQRPKTPDALASQLEEAPNLFSALGIPVYSAPGFEGDDIIATLANKFSNSIPVEILTGDLDTLQMVSDGKIAVRTFRKGIRDTFVYDEAAVRERYGLNPSQLRDYKAMVGDASDNIPGVPGIGDKGAATLLQKYGTLEGVYAAADDSKAELVRKNKQLAEECRHLVTLRTDAPVGGITLDDLTNRFLPEEAEKYFARFGFESLIARLKGVSVTRSAAKAIKKVGKSRSSAPMGGLFSFAAKETPADKPIPSNLNNIVLVSQGGDFANNRTKVGFYLKEALREARRSGVFLAPPYFDIGVAFWLIDSDVKEYSPEFLSPLFLKEEWSGSPAQEEGLYQRALSLLAVNGGTGVMEEIEMPVLPILAEMEERGIRVDDSELEKAEKIITSKTIELEKAIYGAVGREFNINSPSQVGTVLFDELHLPIKGKRSTAYEKLLPLKDKHPVVALILEYRENFKALTTYARPLREKIGEDSRIHTEFLQTAAGTGRLSSRNPNLQNISKGAPYAQEIRRSFVADRGMKLLSLDYSQLELRVLAILSDDPGMRAAFEEKRDIHTATAAAVFHKQDSDVSSQERRVAKALNFGLAYGMGSSAFAQSAGVSRREAEEFIRAYFVSFPRVRQWQEDTKVFAHKHGYVETLSGRRRYLPALSSGTQFLVAEAERQAINHPVQGLGADIIKLAMIDCAKVFSDTNEWGNKVQLLLSIHDELLFGVAEDILDDVATRARAVMEGVGRRFSVPLVCDSKTGLSWGELE
jgi:DNA polymerase-1